MRHGITVIDFFYEQNELPVDVQKEIRDWIENDNDLINQNTAFDLDMIFDESNDSLGWDDKGFPQNSPTYKWLRSQGIDCRNVLLRVRW